MRKFGYFISIGAGINQLPLIQKAKDLGFKVIAIDQNLDAIGFVYSDIKIIHSIFDYRKIYASLLKLFLEEPILGIGVRSFGKAVLTASYLTEKLNLIGTKVDVLQNFYNKKTMKAYLGENKILVPKSYTWDQLKEISKLIQTIPYPCILKPVDAFAKLGIEIFYRPDKLLERLNQIDETKERFLLEEFIEGSEITVLGFVQNGKFSLVSVSDKVTTPYPPFLELSHQLPSTQEKIFGEVKLICQSIAHITMLENSPIVAEFKVTSQGKIYLIEIMPEIGGEFLADHLIPEFYSYDYFLNYIRLLIGEPIQAVNPIIKRREDVISQICFIAPPDGSSKYISANERGGFEGNIFLNRRLRNFGETLQTSNGNSCRVQVFGITSKNTKNSKDVDSITRKIYDAKFE